MANYDEANPLVRILPCRGDMGVNTGAPVARLASQMTDPTKAYVYVGEEDGYNAGHWYYHDGSSWHDGGEYNLANLDTNLDETSTNGVQNKAIAETLEAIRSEMDAKLTQQEETINELDKAKTVTGSHYGYIYPEWEQGAITSSGEVNSNKQIRTADYISMDGINSIEVKAPTTYNFGVYYYNSSKIYIASSIGLNGEYTYEKRGVNFAYFRLVMGYPGAATNITPDKGAELTLRINGGTDKIEEQVFEDWYLSEKIALQKIVGVTRFPNNLVEPSACKNGQYINVGNGNVVSDNRYFCTWYIPVTAGKTYKANLGRNHAWYDNSYDYITGQTGTSIRAGVVAPTGAAYIRFTINKAADGIDNPYMLYFAELENYDATTTIDGLKVDASYNKLIGKTVAIIGDSISTNGNGDIDGNVPEITITEDDVGKHLTAYLTKYDVDAGLTIGGVTYNSSQLSNDTEVDVDPIADDIGKSIGVPANFNEPTVKTWWEVAQEELGFNAIPVCWSGSSITSHQATSDKYKCSYAWHESQIRKCGTRVAGSMDRMAPDVIIIYRGTNDMTHTPYTRLTDGYFEGASFEYPTDDAVSNNFGYKEGYVLLISKLREAYPNAKIFLCTLNVFQRVNHSHFPTNNGLNSLPEYNNAIREIANYMGCGLIEFDKDGITYENCYSEGYLNSDDGDPTHPTDKGHYVMGQKAIADLKAQYGEMEE